MLFFKGMEELNNILEHAKQRHHMIGQYVDFVATARGGLNGKTLDLLEICCHLKAIYMMNMRSREIHWTMSLHRTTAMPPIP
ncbi:hypothetical protein ACOSQ3_021775 [Xanthoceras sorbifolium]